MCSWRRIVNRQMIFANVGAIWLECLIPLPLSFSRFFWLSYCLSQLVYIEANPVFLYCIIFVSKDCEHSRANEIKLICTFSTSTIPNFPSTLLLKLESSAGGCANCRSLVSRLLSTRFSAITDKKNRCKGSALWFYFNRFLLRYTYIYRFVCITH